MKTWAAILVWSSVTLGAFWQFSLRYAVAVPPKEPRSAKNAPLKEVGGLAVQGAGKVRVLNFWSPECGCSAFVEPHVKKIVSEFGKDVEWRTVIISREKGSAAEAWRKKGIAMPGVVDEGDIAESFGIAASPAAVVIDRKGSVVYVGSYNVSRWCQDESTAFARKAIRACLRDQKPAVDSLPFFGCGV